MAVLSLTETVMKHSSDSVRTAHCHRAMGQSVFSVGSVYVFVWALYGGFHVVLGVCIRLGMCFVCFLSFGGGMYVFGVSFVWCFSFRSLLGKFDCMFCSE